MKKFKRVFLLVLDSVGAGAAPDASDFGDAGAHTLRALWQTGELNIPTLRSMGLGCVSGLDFLGGCASPVAAHGRLCEASRGKDTTIGHWELSGHISESPLPTFPSGFGEDILQKIKAISGRPLLCNKPYSGTAVINDYGREALERGALIIYTSADSVLQIAAHVDAVPLQELYRICRELRALLSGAQGVGRIIARPFEGNAKDGFVRTADRRDFSLSPPTRLLPQAVLESGLDSIAVGKINDIFAGVGFSRSLLTHSNREGMRLTEQLIGEDFRGLCFVNLVDFDMKYGHRRDALGYARALCEFDGWLCGVLPRLTADDLLMITADHGCDPSFMRSTDHTREYVPLLVYSPSIKGAHLGTRSSFADVGATVAEALGVALECDGSPIMLDFSEE